MKPSFVRGIVMRRTLLATLALCLQACADSAGDGAEAPACLRNSDCPDPTHLCMEGACRPECGDARDCAEGETCEASRCVPAPIACLADADCPDGQRCGAGLCELAETPCDSDLACDASQRCVEGRCRTVECVVDGDCAAGEGCVANTCEALAAQCARNSDCALGERCLAGRCGPACGADVDCAAGERCVGGACAPECVDAVDCAAGELCRAGLCEPACVVDRDCAAGQLCRSGRCEAECAQDRDCAGGQLCRAGRCEAECVVDRDCAADQACDAGRCVAVVVTNPYGGRFNLSTSTGIQRCNDYVSLQYQSRTVDAVQDGASYTFFFPTSTYYGTIDEAGSFAVSWSGYQDTGPVCGDMNTANTYSGTFQGADLFTGTLAVDFFFQVPACNCTLWFPITGTRL